MGWKYDQRSRIIQIHRFRESLSLVLSFRASVFVVLVIVLRNNNTVLNCVSVFTVEKLQ